MDSTERSAKILVVDDNEQNRALVEATLDGEASMDLLAQVLVRDRALPDDARDTAVQIRGAARHLMRLIHNLLDISKSEEGKLTLKRADVDLHALLAEVREAFDVQTRASSVTLEVAIDVPALVADRDLLQRVLENLTENAIRHAPKGSAERHDREVGLRVTDRGAGIPAEMREKIFDRFVQLDSSSRAAAAPRADELSGLSSVFGVLLRADIAQNAGMRLSLAFAPLSSVLLLALSALACSGTSNDAFSAFRDVADAPEPIRAAAQAVVRIQTARGVATGVFLSKDGRLLTNNHVLGVSVCPLEGCYATLTFAHERGSPLKAPVDVFVTPLHVDVGLDMAVVQAFSVDDSGQPGDKLSAPRSLTLKPRDAASLLETHVHVIGHPHGRLKKWTSGDVFDFDGIWFRATAAALPGNSGSPVLDDDGHIVGLVHRAPSGEDLITPNGANLYSVATTSAAVLAALEAELPATVQSISGPFPAMRTADDVASDEAIYLNAHAATAHVEGAEREVLTILGEACDRGLARGDYISPEDFSDGVSACSAAMRWISCTPSTSIRSWAVCPDEAARTAWRERYQQLSLRQQELNGKLWLDAVSFAQKGLESTEEQGLSVGREGLLQALDSARPPLDLALARYLAAFGIKTYDGKKTLDFLRAYAEVPHYELSVPDIVFTSIWLSRQKALDGAEVEALLADLVDDERVDLGSKLLIEEVQYNTGWIE